MIDIAIVNSHILYKWIELENGGEVLTENEFRDRFIFEIITKYGAEKRPIERALRPQRRPVSAAIRISHGSRLYPVTQKSRCVYCFLHNTVSYTQRKCPDCLDTPALCQTSDKDCHSSWHGSTFLVIRKLWYDKKAKSSSTETNTSSKSRERPKGSINRKRRRGDYCKRLEATQ